MQGLKNKTRIGMVIDKELPDVRVENEASILGKGGFKVILLVLDFSGAKKSSREEREFFTVIHLPFPRKMVKKLRPFSGTILDIYSPIWWRMIRRFIREERIDLVHLNDLYMGLPILGKKVPCIIDLHENYPASVVSYNWSHQFPLNLILSKKIWKRQEGRIFREAEGILVLSNEYAQILEDEYPGIKRKIGVYPNVPDVSVLKGLQNTRQLYEDTGKFTLFYYGVIAERRGIFELLQAVKLLSREISSLRLLLVGPVDSADKQRFEEEMKNLQEMIVYLPWVDFSDFASLIKNVNMGISPLIKNDHHESGVANKIFQYMYFEKPLLVSNCSPQENIVRRHECGYVYSSGNIDELANIIRQAFQERAVFPEMGVRAKKAVEEEYNTEVSGKKLLDFYQQILRAGDKR